MIDRLDGLLRPSRTTVYPVIILVLWPLVWAIMLGTGEKPFLIDFVARWTGGRIALGGDSGRLYDPQHQFELQREIFRNEETFSWFVSPPFEAIILSPFGLLSFPQAGVLWMLLSLLAWVYSFLLLRGMVNLDLIHWRRFVIIAMASLPFLELVFSGQNTSFVLLSLTLSWGALRSDRPLIAGVCLSLALIKPHLIFMIPILWLLERRGLALVGLAVGAGAWILLSAWIFDWVVFEEWLRTFQTGGFVDQVHLGQALKHAGLSGFLTAVLPMAPGILSYLPALLSIGVGLFATVVIWKSGIDETLKWWLVVLVGVVAAPHGMVYDFVLALPGIALALRRWWVPRLRLAAALTWIIFWLYPPVAGGLAKLGAPLGLVQVPWHAGPLIILVVMILMSLEMKPACVTPKGATRLATEEEAV